MRRLSANDRLLAIASFVGIVSCYLGWSASSAAGVRIDDTAFRVSPLGDIFFLAMFVVAVGVLCRGEMIWVSRSLDRITAIAAPVALAALLVQIAASLIARDSLGSALLLALLAAATVEALTVRPIGQRRTRRFGIN